MASSLARGQSRDRSSGSGRSASPSSREGRSSRDRQGAGNNTPAGTSSAGSGAVDCAASAYSSSGSWMPGGFEIGDFVTYIGPSYTFPGTGLTLRYGLEGEVMGHGANVPVEYRSHRFLGIRFFGHTGETNVPPDALAPCFRPPAGPWPGSSRGLEQQPVAASHVSERSELPQRALGSPKEGQGIGVKSSHRPEGADGLEDCIVCCAGPEPVHMASERQEAANRSSCDIASVLDFLFGEGPPENSTAGSPAIATSEFPQPPSPRSQDLQKQQLQQLPQIANPATLGSQQRLVDSIPGKQRGPGSSASSLVGGVRRAG